MIPWIMVIIICPCGVMNMMLGVNSDNQLAVGLVPSLTTPILRLSAWGAVLRKVRAVLHHNRSQSNS